MGVKEDEIAELQEELAAVQATITNILQGGQSFQKGGRTGFTAEQAKLPVLYEKKRELKAKLAAWGIYRNVK
jgi:hypothetical protein